MKLGYCEGNCPGSEQKQLCKLQTRSGPVELCKICWNSEMKWRKDHPGVDKYDKILPWPGK